MTLCRSVGLSVGLLKGRKLNFHAPIRGLFLISILGSNFWVGEAQGAHHSCHHVRPLRHVDFYVSETFRGGENLYNQAPSSHFK